MSFITKRERVFNEYDLYDIPARNEGKLKAYASCTDARAWSHFCSDKSEHLVEIIKRNNDTGRPKYVPTEAIIDTLMVGKNAEISRLQRKIDDSEQMLAVYDSLDLTCEQKCDIAKAHAAILAASRELDDRWYELDLSTFTEGSEGFQTGKSRGDEASKGKCSEWCEKASDTENKGNQVDQAGEVDKCDCSTLAVDPRIEEMQDSIVSKDAKLNAMQNTIAVMENDVCEPYCIYAHIYTALEKIFGVLCQNEKYKDYLSTMTSGKDLRNIDIKGKILFKLKVLEKFSLALIAPCSQDFADPSAQDCKPSCCFRTDVFTRVETAYALTSAESKQPFLDNKRAQLVADIMENDEIKEILSRENDLKNDIEFDEYGTDNYNIDTENLKRLKNLQENYDDLMTCYEASKREKDCLHIRCRNYEELEKEFEVLKGQLREYNALWNEKEHFKRRSADLGTSLSHLKEQFLVLSDETSNLEAQVKAESEINNVKCRTIEDLRRENLLLEQKLNEVTMLFEREKNHLQCKIKECDCRAMCQDQQIKSLSVQIDRLLEHDSDRVQYSQSEQASIALKDEINSLNEQITNLKGVCCCNEKEKLQIQDEYENQLKLINDLKSQVEDLKSAYEKTLKVNDYLETYSEHCRDEIQQLQENNLLLTRDVEEKTTALEELVNLIKRKSQDVHRLSEDMEKRNKENSELYNKIQVLQETYNQSFTALDDEKSKAITSLQLARQESQELLEKVKNYDDMVHKQEDLASSFQSQNEEYNSLKSMLIKTQEQKISLQKDLKSRDSKNSILQQEIQRLHEENQFAVNNIASLQEEKTKYKILNELSSKESLILQEKLHKFEDVTHELQRLRDSHETLVSEKERLENELQNKTTELDDALHSIRLTRQESDELINKLHESDSLKTDFSEMNDAYKRIIIEKQELQGDLIDKRKELDNLLKSFNQLHLQNELKSQEVDSLTKELADLKRAYDKLLAEKNVLQSDLNNKSDQLNNLYHTLETKIKENMALSQRLSNSERNNEAVTSNLNSLMEENASTKSNLNILKQESDGLMDRVKYYETLESEYDKLKKDHDKMREEKESLEQELNHQVTNLRRVKRENHDLSSQSQELLSHSEDLEKALISARTELIVKSSLSDNPHDMHDEIIKEIEELKQEKLSQHKKIRDLFDKLDESENVISDLSEVILARDDRIALLENHINQLEDEVRKLHNSLAEVVNTGEQITDRSSQQINQSLSSMEAHHSRATHNMKMELAKLQSENTMLEEKLSASKMRNEEKRKYLSQISHLHNEREIIVTDIKQLEIRSIGDSALSPERCSVEDILGSLDRIRKYLDDRCSKSNSLEQTLLSVQNSYQLVQTKTDEAKKIVEKEKHKIMNEKEEAIRDKINMEKQLIDLKKQLELDKNVIKDLEREILNQKLIIDKLNESTQSYISKLEDDMKSVQTLYHNALKEITALENKFKSLSEEKSIHKDIIERTSKDLQEKIKEVELLNKKLAELKKEPEQNESMQTSSSPFKSNVKTQTDTRIKKYEEPGDLYSNEKYNMLEDRDISPIRVSKTTRDKKPRATDKNKIVNEVQVLTANVDPSFDYVKSSYLNYKFKQLGPGRLEQYTISCGSESDIVNEGFSTSILGLSEIVSKPSSSKDNAKDQSFKVIDIYNKKSMHTNSSKANDNDDTENEVDPHVGANQTKSLAKSSYVLTNESIATESNIRNEYKNSNDMFESTSELSTDKDLFVIYKDSESNNDSKSYEKKAPWNANGQSEIVVEALISVHQSKNDQPSTERSKKIEIANEPYLNAEDEDGEDDSVKHKLKISLPRVDNDSPSIEASDAEKRSLDSYTMAIYTSPKGYSSSNYNTDSRVKFEGDLSKTPSTHSISHDKLQYINTSKAEKPRNVNIRKDSAKSDKNRYIEQKPAHQANESHHKLSRVGADVLLIKSEEGNNDHIASNLARQQKSRDFGLDYILDSHKYPDNIKTYNAAKAVRQTRSDERFDLSKPEESDATPTRSSDFKKSSTEYKTMSSNSYSKSTDKSQLKSYKECSVMVKLDTVDEYEKKIRQLTRTLENIEKDYKKKIDAIKIQYDSNIKSILNEHNQGVESIQSLHEETLQDILKMHENEVENLRTMSIEAMRKADKLEKENKTLKNKMLDSSSCLDEEPIKMSTPELRRRKRSRIDSRLLTKTTVEAFNVKPKTKSNGPCTCSLDIDISDTIRNIFEQVDVEQRKMSEYSYLKYIANKIISGNFDALDTQELSFLHLKVCRIWKTKMTKEESLQKRIDSLETELMNKQKHTQQNIAALDRKVAEERRRLQEVREAVCRSIPVDQGYAPPAPAPTAEKDNLGCACAGRQNIGERRSAGDLVPVPGGLKQKRTRNESNRAVLAKMDAEERREREKKIYTDELPTRLRKSHDRSVRSSKR